MEKVTITLFLLVLCVRVEYMLGASVAGGRVQNVANDQASGAHNLLNQGGTVSVHPTPNAAPSAPDAAAPALDAAAPALDAAAPALDAAAPARDVPAPAPDAAAPAPDAAAPASNVAAPAFDAASPNNNDYHNHKNVASGPEKMHRQIRVNDTRVVTQNGTQSVSHKQTSQSALDEGSRHTSSQVTLYESLLANCPDVKNLKDFSKEPIFRVCSNWTASDQNITQVSSTNTTRALCTVYRNGFTTFCARLKSFNKSISDSSIELNPPNAQVNIINAAEICDRLTKQLKVFEKPMDCMKICYNDEISLQCHLADHYYNYKLKQPVHEVSQDVHKQDRVNNMQENILPDPNIMGSLGAHEHSDPLKVTKSDPSIKSSTKAKGSQEVKQADDTHVVEAEGENNPSDESVPEVKENLTRNGDAHPDPAKDAENDVPDLVHPGPPEIEEPPSGKKPPTPQEGDENDEQNPFDNDKDSVDPPEGDYADQESPKKTDDEKSILKPNQLEEDIPISEDDIDGESYFFSYFMIVCVLFVLGYVFYHNRTKVLGFVIEGKRNKRQLRGRRPNSANYHKLDSNLEEAISSSCTKSKTNVIY